MSNLLERLVNADGISGDEQKVRDIIIAEIKKYVDEIHVDKMGNVIARKKGKKPSVALVAHMDEVGLMVKAIEDSGRIRFITIGGLEPAVALSQRVDINGIKGIVTTELVEKGVVLETLPKLDDMFIDTGLDKKAIGKRIRIGDYATFYQEPFCILGNENLVSGKSLDDRVGCYSLLEIAKRSKSIKSEIIFIFTVQEEIGMHGAGASVYDLDPDYAIIVDAENHEDEGGEKLVGQGPFITIKDSSTITSRKLNNVLEKTAKELSLNLQRDVSDFGSTDALKISLAKGGIPSTVLGFFVKNIHCPVSIADMRDIDSLIKILEEFLKDPPKHV
ncbi:MAG: M42 family metallopeptidase [Candidatus Aenigmarchaeota archaeon]|nr:M42 family metallopeptidase [Candidatus Aenigmarchaeota archaeon]